MFDPIDLAIMAAALETARNTVKTAPGFSIEAAQELVEAAEMLHRLWLENAENWGGVWAYEVAEPLGYLIGERFSESGAMPDAADVESWARDLVRVGLELQREGGAA